MIRERLRPATGCGTAVAPPTFAPSGRGKSDYHCDGEDPQNWPAVLQAVAAGRVVNRCTLDSILAGEPDGGSSGRFEGTSIPKVTLTGVKGESMSLLDVGHRVADAALWSAENYEDFQNALEAYVRGDAGRLARLRQPHSSFGYWSSRGRLAGRHGGSCGARFAENVVRLTRKSQYWASVDPEANEDLRKALEEARAKAKDDEEKELPDRNSASGDAPASGLGGVIAHGEITRLTILSLTGFRISRCDWMKKGRFLMTRSRLRRRTICASISSR